MRFAFIMVEEHTGAAVHLRDNHPLRAIDNKCAIIGHKGQIAHIDFLLFNVFDRLGAGFFINIKHHQTERHFQRSGISHATLLALFDVIFGFFKIIGDEFQHGSAGEITNRENRFEHSLQTVFITTTIRLLHL